MQNASLTAAASPLLLEGPQVSRDNAHPIHGAKPLLIAVAVLLVGLFWDFSWESTVGVDLFWSPPHSTIYLALAIAGVSAATIVFRNSAASAQKNLGVMLGRLEAPFGAWVCLWGVLAFVAATLFDRWWQTNYGLMAGLWHPPQIAKTVGFFAVALGAWLLCLSAQNRNSLTEARQPALGFCAAAGLLLALISFVSLTSIYPNRQHSAFFYRLASIVYPLLLVATAVAGKLRFSASLASLFYMASISLLIWLLPLFPAKPQVAPIYNPLDHLMPPPFPLLLIIPAIGIDAVVRVLRTRLVLKLWLQPAVFGLLFFVLFIATQWVFAEFLLSDLADNRFFAGGGKHWPFFFKIDPITRTSFWDLAQDRLTMTAALVDAALAVASAAAGLAVGNWMKTVRR